MKVIETLYKGILFRSRLEAKWAVFFDNLGIEWFYEHEGYDLGSSIWYLPDFWLPTFNGGMFAEVKPEAFTQPEMNKAVELVDQTNGQLMMCVGKPDFKIIYWLCKEYCQQHGIYKQVGLCYGLPNADQAEGENRMFISPGYEDITGRISEEDYSLLGETFVKAVNKANSERFSRNKTKS